jgi:hypothetical protein
MWAETGSQNGLAIDDQCCGASSCFTVTLVVFKVRFVDSPEDERTIVVQLAFVSTCRSNTKNES